MTAEITCTDALRNAAAATIPPAIVIPTALLVGVTVLYRFHHSWRWIRVTLLWSNPDNFVQLCAGRGVNLLFGDKQPVRIAALMVGIPSRIVDCLEEYEKLAKAWDKWLEAINDDCPYPHKVKWVESSQGGILSPARRAYWLERPVAMRMRAQRIIVRTYKLGKRMYILSMRCVDAAEALSLKKRACDDIVNEFFLDATNAVHRIARRREEVDEKLHKYGPLVNKLLRQLGGRFTADRLFDSISTAMEGVEIVDNNIRAVTRCANGAVVDLGKHAVFGVFSILGIPEKIPVCLMPGAWEERYFERHPTETYVPLQYLTQPTAARDNPVDEDAIEVFEIAMKHPPSRKPKRVSPDSRCRLRVVQEKVHMGNLECNV